MGLARTGLVDVLEADEGHAKEGSISFLGMGRRMQETLPCINKVVGSGSDMTGMFQLASGEV